MKEKIESKRESKCWKFKLKKKTKTKQNRTKKNKVSVYSQKYWSARRKIKWHRQKKINSSTREIKKKKQNKTNEKKTHTHTQKPQAFRNPTVLKVKNIINDGWEMVVVGYTPDNTPYTKIKTICHKICMLFVGNTTHCRPSIKWSLYKNLSLSLSHFVIVDRFGLTNSVNERVSNPKKNECLHVRVYIYVYVLNKYIFEWIFCCYCCWENKLDILIGAKIKIDDTQL